jgi:hypothetical protein
MSGIYGHSRGNHRGMHHGRDPFIMDLQHEILDAYERRQPGQPPQFNHHGSTPDGQDGPLTRRAYAGLSAQDRQAIAEKLKEKHKHVDTRLAREGAVSHPDEQIVPSLALPPVADMGKTAVFDMRTGTITLPDGSRFAAGSGKGNDRNNVGAERHKDSGPVPEGVWNVGEPAPATFEMADGSTRSSTCLRLGPAAGTDPMGRDKLLMHETHSGNPNDLHSIGCIALKKQDMAALLAARAHGEFTQVIVTRDARALHFAPHADHREATSAPVAETVTTFGNARRGQMTPR